MRNKMPFISMEGIDGTGKTTQCQLLLPKLGTYCKKFVQGFNPKRAEHFPEVWKAIRAPDYAFPLGRAIRHGLYNGGFANEYARALMYCKDRADTSKRLERDIQEGCVCGFLADRWSMSEYVYSQEKGIPEPAARAIVKNVEIDLLGSWVPDLTILLVVDPKEAKKRMIAMHGSEDLLDFNEKHIEPQLKRQLTYMGLCRNTADKDFSDRIVPVETTGKTVEEVHKDVIIKVEEYFMDKLELLDYINIRR